jgi:SH3-like domain-containing protein
VGIRSECAYNFIWLQHDEGVRSMTTLPALTARTEFQRWREVRDEDGLWSDLRPELLEAVKTILETTMEDESPNDPRG